MKLVPMSVALGSCLALCCWMPITVSAQEKAAVEKPASKKPAPEKRARVFVTDSDSWQSQSTSGGGIAAFTAGFGSVASAGARPQTAEIMKTIGERCPNLLVNNRADLSDYVVRLEHEGGKGVLSHRNKVVVFTRGTGDAIFSNSTITLGGSVQGACAAIERDWMTAATAVAPAVEGGARVEASLTVEANVPGADIEIDEAFVGSAPSTVSMVAGRHTISVKKKGYTEWSRTMVVAGSGVRLSAELEAKL